MRNAFVGLVFLCIGFISGFIVPSSVPEKTVRKSIFNIDDVKVESTQPTKYAVLPKSRSDIDEKDLYEHATDKKNNQSERAFVYINQKYNKKPVRSKVIKMFPIENLEFDYAFTTPPSMTLTSAEQTPWPSAFDSAPKYNSKFQDFNEAEHKQQHIISPYLPSPLVFRCKFNDCKKNNNIEVNMQVPTSNRVDERRDYFELLKPPILRPGNHKVNYGNIHEIPSPVPLSIPYRDKSIKKYSLKKQYVAKAKEADVQQNDMWENYEHNGAFIRGPAHQPKDIINRAEKAHFEEDFTNDDIYKKDSTQFDNNQEDKLLDKFLQDTFEEIPFINANDRVRGNLPNCMKEDCHLEPRRKKSKSNGILIKPDCKCGRISKVKQVDPFFSKDRSLREKSDRNETLPKSSEVIYYEAMLSDDSNTMKVDNNIVRPPGEVN